MSKRSIIRFDSALTAPGFVRHKPHAVTRQGLGYKVAHHVRAVCVLYCSIRRFEVQEVHDKNVPTIQAGRSVQSLRDDNDMLD